MSHSNYELKIVAAVPSYDKYGDLYNMMPLPGYKQERIFEQLDAHADTSNAVKVYLLGDSYVMDYVQAQDISGQVIGKYNVNDLGNNIAVLDTTAKNILVLEICERNFPSKILESPCTILKLDTIKNNSNLINDTSQESIQNQFVFAIEKYLIYVASHLNIGYKVRELNTYFQNRILKKPDENVVINSLNNRLYISNTVNQYAAGASFFNYDSVITSKIDSALLGWQQYALTMGFKKIIFSIIPNPSSIYETSWKGAPYNNFITQLQNKHSNNFEFVNIFDKYKSAKLNLYFNNDTHWNGNGKLIWAKALNQILKDLK
jgi:hypothetical protein